MQYCIANYAILHWIVCSLSKLCNRLQRRWPPYYNFSVWVEHREVYRISWKSANGEADKPEKWFKSRLRAKTLSLSLSHSFSPCTELLRYKININFYSLLCGLKLYDQFKTVNGFEAFEMLDLIKKKKIKKSIPLLSVLESPNTGSHDSAPVLLSQSRQLYTEQWVLKSCWLRTLSIDWLLNCRAKPDK